ncbi:MAG: carbonic anhydrase [Verrucomicrobiales bacterium]|nr:carbonic anhydrase [Verrucomicrobiales bacterium]
MRLFDAILDANHRALAGDTSAGVHPADFPTDMPVIALTCIDPRLNRLFPDVLGLPEDQFIWLRNAGNIIFDPFSSMMRTLALACAVKGGREIAVIGHTDCKVSQSSVSNLIDSFKALGIERSKLPDNLNEFFGLFASERQNVIRGVDIIRSSPLIGPKIPVHGMVVDVNTGKLEWIVNGYDMLARGATPQAQPSSSDQNRNDMPTFAPARFDFLKIPDVKIGEIASNVKEMFEKPDPAAPTVVPPPAPVEPAAQSPSSRGIPVPPRLADTRTIRIPHKR